MLGGVLTLPAHEVMDDAAEDDSGATETVQAAVDLPGHDAWDNYCFVCKEGCDANSGVLGCCAGCHRVFHNGCHVPRVIGRMEDLPYVVKILDAGGFILQLFSDDWKCSLCVLCEPLRVRTPHAFGRHAQDVSFLFLSQLDRRFKLCSKVLLTCFLGHQNAPIFLESPAHNNFRHVADRVSQRHYASPEAFIRDVLGIISALETVS